MRAPGLWCCVSSSRKKVQVATPQPQLCEMTVWSFGQNTPKRPKCTCDRLDLPESTQPDPPGWAAENVCFQSCIVWLFLQWLRDGWLGLRVDSLWPILSDSDLLSLLQVLRPTLGGDLAMTVDIPMIRMPRCWFSAGLCLPHCREVNSFLEDSSTLVSWLLGFCIFRQSFSLWFPDMIPSFYSPKAPALYFYLLLPLPCINSAWHARLALTRLWAPWVQGQCLIQFWFFTALIQHLGLGMCPRKKILKWMSEWMIEFITIKENSQKFLLLIGQERILGAEASLC